MLPDLEHTATKITNPLHRSPTAQFSCTHIVYQSFCSSSVGCPGTGLFPCFCPPVSHRKSQARHICNAKKTHRKVAHCVTEQHGMCSPIAIFLFSYICPACFFLYDSLVPDVAGTEVTALLVLLGFLRVSPLIARLIRSDQHVLVNITCSGVTISNVTIEHGNLWCKSAWSSQLL